MAICLAIRRVLTNLVGKISPGFILLPHHFQGIHNSERKITWIKHKWNVQVLTKSFREVLVKHIVDVQSISAISDDIQPQTFPGRAAITRYNRTKRRTRQKCDRVSNHNCEIDTLISGSVYTNVVSFVTASFSMRLRLLSTRHRSRPLQKPGRFENAAKSGAFSKRYGFFCRVNSETSLI